MSSGKDLADFPDVHAKLQKPTKQSAFEKQKAEAEAKRQREEAETAAVYQDFIKSFDRDDDGDDDEGNNRAAGRGLGFGTSQRASSHRPGFSGPPSGAGPSRRHFGTSGLKSGPGSLGPPPPSFGKKRSFNDFSRGHRDRPSTNDADPNAVSVPEAFGSSDDEEQTNTADRAQEKAIARPTLRLINLPPGTSPQAIKALLPDSLVLEHVKIEPPSTSTSSERKFAVAIVTLSQDTPVNEIDSVVSSLQNRYLGYGHYLSLHRHLSSAVAASTTLSHPGLTGTDSQPFGAKPVDNPVDSNSRHGQHGFRRGFAPPTSYNTQSLVGIKRSNILHVPVKPPTEIRTIRLINKVIEGVLDNGPEFEALLMSRPEVQREEKWAWLWDARSEGGTWYRWRLWEIVTGAGMARTKGKFVPLFDGSHAWKTPDKHLPFEFTTEFEEIASDPDYTPSDDEDLDGEANRENPGNEVEEAFLDPLEKAHLSHLLARMPATLAKVRKGDIARVTGFAINHASRGVEEVVGMIVSNIEKPLSLTMANPDCKHGIKDAAQGTNADENFSAEANDTSGASLIALYVVSDILSSSSTSGVRHAWRFRQLFENALRQHKTFEKLGEMAEKLGWGRLRADKWKRSVNIVLNLWEGWCVFPSESQELFNRSFFESLPVLKVENKAADPPNKSKWKVVEATQAEGTQGASDQDGIPVAAPSPHLPPQDTEGEPINDDDVMGEPVEDEDIDGDPIDEDDIIGEPAVEEDVEGEPMDEDEDEIKHALPPPTKEAEDQGLVGAKVEVNLKGSTGVVGPMIGTGSARKPRMRAVDMFADSDGSDAGS